MIWPDTDVTAVIATSVGRQLADGARTIDAVIGRAIAEALTRVTQPSAPLSIIAAEEAFPELNWQELRASELSVTSVDELAFDLSDLLWPDAIVSLLESHVSEVGTVFSVAGSTATMMTGDGFSVCDFSLDRRTYFFASGDPEVCLPFVWFAHGEGELDARERAVRSELEANEWFGGAVRIPEFPDLDQEARGQSRARRFP